MTDYIKIFIIISIILCIYSRPHNGYYNNIFVLFNPNQPNCDRRNFSYLYQHYDDHVNKEDLKEYFKCLESAGYFNTKAVTGSTSTTKKEEIVDVTDEITTNYEHDETTINPLDYYKPVIEFVYYKANETNKYDKDYTINKEKH